MKRKVKKEIGSREFCILMWLVGFFPKKIIYAAMMNAVADVTSGKDALVFSPCLSAATVIKAFGEKNGI